jgi:hypothetical protein
LAGIVKLFGHSAGGRPSEELMARLGMPVSDTTILRSVKEGMLMLRLFIGLGIPLIAIVAMLPVVNEVTFTLCNIPALYLWMFSWFVLSSACLGICWLCFDRHRPED